MKQYINKDALVAEIERISNEFEYLCDSYDEGPGFQHALDLIKSFINTLEVKEVDLEKVFNDEYSKFSNDIDADYAFPIDLADYRDFAKHFFELGIKSQKGE